MEFEIANPAAAGEIFDTHAHYDPSTFKSDVYDILDVMPSYGVGGVVSCSINLYESAEENLQLTQKYNYVYTAFGIHPECVGGENPFDAARLKELFALCPRAVAVGEIGLDYHWRDDNKAAQIACFKNQLALANELGLPCLIHDRDAHGDMMNILHEMKPRGVVHCFSGSAEMAEEIVKLGLYIGIGGVVTFKNAKKLISVVEKIPLDRILLETDAPFMAPEPLRGRTNNSAYICFIAEKIAEIKGLTREEVLKANRENVNALFFGGKNKNL